MPLRAQIWSSPKDAITVTTRSLPSANPSLSWIHKKHKTICVKNWFNNQRWIAFEENVSAKNAIFRASEHFRHYQKSLFWPHLAEQVFIGGKPQIVLAVTTTVGKKTHIQKSVFLGHRSPQVSWK